MYPWKGKFSLKLGNHPDLDQINFGGCLRSPSTDQRHRRLELVFVVCSLWRTHETFCLKLGTTSWTTVWRY